MHRRLFILRNHMITTSFQDIISLHNHPTDPYFSIQVHKGSIDNITPFGSGRFKVANLITLITNLISNLISN